MSPSFSYMSSSSALVSPSSRLSGLTKALTLFLLYPIKTMSDRYKDSCNQNAREQVRNPDSG
jgi:hypothetical protein